MIQQLIAQLQSSGLDITTLNIDGDIHRVKDTIVGGKENKNAWYSAHRIPHHNEAYVVNFGSWAREEINDTLKSWELDDKDNSPGISPADYEKWRKQQQRQAEKKKAQENKKIAQQAQDTWQHLSQFGEHPYLEKKNILPHIARFGDDYYGPYLAIPMYNIDGELRNLQKIRTGKSSDNDKYFLGGTSKGLFCRLGELDIRHPQDIHLCEGYATGATLYAAMDYQEVIIVAFVAGNLPIVAQALRKKYPQHNIIIRADNDQWPGKDGIIRQAGITKAKIAAESVNGHWTTPDFSRFDDNTDKPTDYNDLARKGGIEEVVSQLRPGADTLTQNVPHEWRQARKHKDIGQATTWLTDTYHLPTDALKPELHYGYEEGHIIFPLIDTLGDIHTVAKLNIEQATTSVPHSPGLMYAPHLPWVKKAKHLWLVRRPLDALILTLAKCPAVAYLSAEHAKKLPLNWIKPNQAVTLWPEINTEYQHSLHTLYHRIISHGYIAEIVYSDTLPQGLAKDTCDGDLTKLREIANNPITALFPAGSPWFKDPQAWGRLQYYQCHRDTVNRTTDDGIELIADWRPYRVDPIELLPERVALYGMSAGRPHRKTLIHYARPDAENALLTDIIEAHELGSDATYNKLGITYNPKAIKTLIGGLSRDNRFGKKTVNVIGLVKMGDDSLQLNDAQNTYQRMGDYVYHDLIFPDTPQSQAAHIIRDLDKAFTDHKALFVLNWVLGSFLKVFTKSYPHMMMSAGHDSGKSRLFGWLTHLTGFLAFPHTEPGSSYRRIQLVRGHFFPVGVDEISRFAAEYRDDFRAFVHILNECYDGKTLTHSKNPFFACAPVIMTGQDDPFQHDAALDAKMLKFNLDTSKGTEYFPQKNIHFPVRAWAEWIKSTITDQALQSRLADITQTLLTKVGDELSQDKTRFVKNYAMQILTWEYLEEFAGIKGDIRLGRTIYHFFHRHLTEGKPMRKESYGILKEVAELLYSESPQTYPLIKIKEDGWEYKMNDEGHQVQENNYIICTSASIILRFLEKHKKGHAVTSPQKLLDHLEADGFLIKRKNGKRTGTVYIRRTQINSGIWLSWNKIQAAGIDWPRSSQQMESTQDQKEEVEFSLK